MSKFPADDELLSSILDGEASAESIASVEADPEQAQRLADMKAAVEVVASAPDKATPERRSASIAAAMAAATPASPEITSLAAQRHKREEKKRSVPGGWIAAAAAVLLFVLAVPVIFGLGGGTAEVADSTGAIDAVTTADAADVTDEAEEVVEEEVVEESADDVPADQSEAGDEAMEDDAMEDEDSEEAESAEEETSNLANQDADRVNVDTQVVQSLEELGERITSGSIAPVLDGEDLLARVAPVTRTGDALDEALSTEVNPDCVASNSNATTATYDIAVFDPFAGAARLVIIEFGVDGTSRVLDAETCAVID